MHYIKLSPLPEYPIRDPATQKMWSRDAPRAVATAVGRVRRPMGRELCTGEPTRFDG